MPVEGVFKEYSTTPSKKRKLDTISDSAGSSSASSSSASSSSASSSSASSSSASSSSASSSSASSSSSANNDKKTCFSYLLLLLLHPIIDISIFLFN